MTNPVHTVGSDREAAADYRAAEAAYRAEAAAYRAVAAQTTRRPGVPMPLAENAARAVANGYERLANELEEIERIRRRRPDAILPREQSMALHPSNSGNRSPQASLLLRVAALMVSEDLPPARLTISGRDVIVDATGADLVENTVRRWAAALDLLVTEIPTDTDAGVAATLWSASGWDGSNNWFHIAGAEPVSA